MLPILQPPLCLLRHSRIQTRPMVLPNKPHNPAFRALPRPWHADAQCPVPPHLKQTSELRSMDPLPPPNCSAFFFHFCFHTCEAGPSPVTFILLFLIKVYFIMFYLAPAPGFCQSAA